MKFCLIRLGKDSVEEITAINLLNGIQIPAFSFTLKCKQVPHEVNEGTYCFVWLGSDNNKGTSTPWKQGLRAFGIVTHKSGGPNYSDEWYLELSLGVILFNSLTRADILQRASQLYIRFSGIPIVGINSHSNQSVQMIKPDNENQDINAFLTAIGRCDESFVEAISRAYPIEGLIYLDSGLLNENLQDPVIENEGVTKQVLMKQPFNPALINIENKLLNIDLIIKRLSQRVPEIDLYPDFQRRDDLWDSTQQSRLIESILIRFPLPAFYFDGTNKDKWLVVDGLQRLSSLRNFVVTKELKLTNLEFLSSLEGFGYDDLDRDLQRVIEETQVVAYIINPGTPADVKFNIFKRINTGGLVLESQEIRHALFQGAPAKLLAELADLEDFKLVTDFTIKSDRMLDREFVNRFLSFYLIGVDEYTSDLDSFMNKSMLMVYSLDDLQLDQCKLAFKRSMRTNYNIFGNRAFRKVSSFDDRRRPINRALFDTLSVVIAKLNQAQCEHLIQRRQQVINGLADLINQDPAFFSAISSSTNEKNKVIYRFNQIGYLVSNNLDN